MPNAQYSYPLDLTGQASANLVTEERHTISQVNGRTFNFIVPTFAPFYAASVKLYTEVNSIRTPLLEGQGFNPAAEFQGASAVIGKPIYGALSLTDLNYSGDLIVQYQTLGGEYTLGQAAITEIIANIVLNPRGSTWEQLANLPTMFPPITHPWNFNDMVGQTELIAQLKKIEDAILGQANAGLEAHLRDMLNPHGVSKNQLQLDRVENYGPASVLQAIAMNSSTTLLTPSTLKAVLDNLGLLDLSSQLALITTHINNTDNPHEDTKFDLDLGNVENLPVATPSDIVAKKRVRKYLTLDMALDLINLYLGQQTSDEANYPAKDALLSMFCNGLNRMGVYALGDGGTYEKIIQINSPDCGYVPPPANPTNPPQGTLLSKYCAGYDQMGIYADGYGGSFSRMIQFQSSDCGYAGTSAPGSYPPANTILSTRCEGTTLVTVKANGQGGSYDERTVNSPQCPATPTCPAKDSLLSTFCDGFDMKGRYADGNCGTYNAIIQRNSTDCGYQSTTTPAPTTTSTPTPTPSVTQTLTPAPTAGNRTIFLASDKTTITTGTVETQTASLSGFTPNTTVTMLAYVKTNIAVGGTPANTPIQTLSVQVSIDANGKGSWTLTQTDSGITPAATYDCWLSTTSPQIAESNHITRTFVRQQATKPVISIALDKSSISVGGRANMTVNYSGLSVGKTYTVITYRQHTGDSAFSQYYSPVTFVAQNASGSYNFSVDNNGDINQGLSQFKATITQANDSSMTGTSSTINLTYNNNRSITLAINGSTTSLSGVIGTSFGLRVDMRDMPITGSATDSYNQPLKTYILTNGSVLNASSPWQTQINSSGSSTTTGDSTLAPDMNYRGNMTFQYMVEWKDQNGTIQRTYSNTVTVNFTGGTTTTSPPNNGSNASVVLSSNYAQPNIISPYTTETISVQIYNGVPNTSYQVQWYTKALSGAWTGNTYNTLTRTMTTDGSGYAIDSYTQTTDGNNNSVPDGVYDNWVVVTNLPSANGTSNHIYRQFATYTNGGDSGGQGGL